MLDKNKPQGVKSKPIVEKKKYDLVKYICYGVSVALVISLSGLITFMKKADVSDQIATSLSKKVKKLEEPVYDEKYDFLVSQCDKGAFCVNVDTDNPSLELFKFLVNFREQPNHLYRLFFEISVGKSKVTQPIKYSCDTQDSEFYICQEITSATPTDVMRVFATSYKALTKDATYSFHLMVKPISELTNPNPVAVTPNPNLVFIPIQKDVGSVSGVEGLNEAQPTDAVSASQVAQSNGAGEAVKAQASQQNPS